jgi:hypothetical protein
VPLLGKVTGDMKKTGLIKREIEVDDANPKVCDVACSFNKDSEGHCELYDEDLKTFWQCRSCCDILFYRCSHCLKDFK